MHVCLICVEMFGLGHYGGFGRATRIIGRELASRNIHVTVVIPRRSRQWPDEILMDGFRVLQFRPSSPRSTVKLFRSLNADLFHSQDASMGTYWAQKAAPDRPHLITFRDPLDRIDWKTEWRHAGPNKFGWMMYSLFVGNRLVTSAVRKASGRYCAAEFLVPKVIKKYGLQETPEFLPTPVSVPDRVSKSHRPTVCFVGRWHRRKRPELFLQLARQLPDVHFIAVGAANEKSWDDDLRHTYGGLDNLEMPGAIDQFQSEQLGDILSKSWILVNSSDREGLPTAFIEAAAHRCAILSCCDPDGFASRFGRRVLADELRDGLEYLFEKDRWRTLGEKGYEHVRHVFSLETSIQRHVQVYRSFSS